MLDKEQAKFDKLSRNVSAMWNLDMPIEKYIESKIVEIAELTEDNACNEARAIGIRLLQRIGTPCARGLEKRYNAIRDEHKVLGHMTETMIRCRFMIDKEMWAMAERRLTPELGAAFKAAY
jgi:hypothetical protein